MEALREVLSGDAGRAREGLADRSVEVDAAIGAGVVTGSDGVASEDRLGGHLFGEHPHPASSVAREIRPRYAVVVVGRFFESGLDADEQGQAAVLAVDDQAEVQVQVTRAAAEGRSLCVGQVEGEAVSVDTVGVG